MSLWTISTQASTHPGSPTFQADLTLHWATLALTGVAVAALDLVQLSSPLVLNRTPGLRPALLLQLSPTQTHSSVAGMDLSGPRFKCTQEWIGALCYKSKVFFIYIHNKHCAAFI